MIDQLPTFIFSRYQNGEFGDISDTSTPEGKQSKKNAQLRLAHFMINGLGTALSNMSHTIRKDGVQEESDYENYQRSNLEQGMQNRWAKYKADTDGAIKAVEKEFGNEQDARLAAEQFTRDKKANLYWNMMDQDQMEAGDLHFKEEGDWIRQISSAAYDVIIADPLFRRALPVYKGLWIDLPHFAVSGKRMPVIGSDIER